MIKRALLPARSVSPGSWALLLVTAVAVGVAGYLHGQLDHRGYAEVAWVGPLFLLNLIATTVVIMLLVLRRVALFLLGALAISIGSLVSILISHSTSFLGFAENRYDTSATLIVVAECVATALGLLAIVTATRDHRAGDRG